jgi:hypothetical protein
MSLESDPLSNKARYFPYFKICFVGNQMLSTSFQADINVLKKHSLCAHPFYRLIGNIKTLCENKNAPIWLKFIILAYNKGAHIKVAAVTLSSPRVVYSSV